MKEWVVPLFRLYKVKTNRAAVCFATDAPRLPHGARGGFLCEYPVKENFMSKPKKIGIVELVSRIALEITDKLGLELWDVRFEKEGASWFLRVFIDKESGVVMDDCEAVSRYVDKRLDELDPIDDAYYLEVSSPGIERDLIKKEHFERFAGTLVRVRFIRPVDGKREYIGELLPMSGDTLSIRTGENGILSFRKAETSYIRVYDDFDIGGIE